MDIYSVRNELKETREDLARAYTGINPDKKRP